MDKGDLSMECFKEEVMQSLQQIYNKLGEIDAKLTEKAKTLNKPVPDNDITYQNKRNAYLAKLNNSEVLTPKPNTLQYYSITKDGDRYV